MSRVGNNPITIPDGVVVDIQTDQITVKGKFGELSQPYDTVTFTQEDTVLTVSRPSEAKPHKAKHETAICISSWVNETMVMNS